MAPTTVSSITGQTKLKATLWFSGSSNLQQRSEQRRNKESQKLV